MATLGTGIIPGGAQGTELTYITRRAYLPSAIVQIYQSSPLIAALMANMHTAMGGISSVTATVQGASMVNTQWSDFSMTFNQPAYQVGLQNAEFNLKLAITPIAYLGAESLVQDRHATLPRIEAVMNDATNNMVDTFAYALYNNTTNTQQFIGLPGAVDDSSNLVTYGGINRTSNPWWKAQVKNASSATITRATVLQYIARTVGGPTQSGTPSANLYGGSEMPNFGVCGMATWAQLAADYIGSESFTLLADNTSFDQQRDGAKSAFLALQVAGVPIYADPYCPEGTLYLLNTNYIGLHMHQAAQFAFTGFYSMIPNMQVGYVAALITAAELVCVKPKTQTRVYSLGYATL